LCANLFEGGTTPSAGTIILSRQALNIPLHVLIRPRGGDFLYSEDEFAVIKQDIEVAKQAGADGVVIGVLKPDGTIDQERTAELINLARPMSITFHRAFDVAKDPIQALHQLIELKIDRLLTSGQEKTALEGSELINKLIKIADERITIMPGAGISERNIERIKRETGAREFHLSARKKVPSNMQHKADQVFMGGELRLPEYETSLADAARISQVLALVNP
jgi:copper homeostasis protein